MNITDRIPPTLKPAIEDFRLVLRAARKSPKTQRTYCDAAALLATRLPVSSWQDITRTHVREHMAWLGDTYSAAYTSNQYRALAQFFKHLDAEDGIPNPMAGMAPPAVPPKLVPVLAAGELGQLLAACTGRDFTAIRDRAIIALFASSGARLSEIASLKVHEVDLEQEAAIVTGKFSKQRIIRFNAATTLALSRYLRARKRYASAGDWLWVGQRGRLQPNGIYQMFVRRGQKAGVKINPHRLRHDFSHRWLAAGGNEGDLMAQNGWNSVVMLRRYGASAAAERARQAYDRVMG